MNLGRRVRYEPVAFPSERCFAEIRGPEITKIAAILPSVLSRLNLFRSASPELIASASVLIRTVLRRLSKDDVPQVLKDFGAIFIAHRRLQKPVAVVSILMSRPLEDLPPWDDELSTSGCSNNAWEEHMLAKHRSPDIGHLFFPYHCGTEGTPPRLKSCRTTRGVCAAEARVAMLLDEVQIESPEKVNSVSPRRIVAYGFAVGVDESHEAWQVVVVVDDEGQISHCFLALDAGDGQHARLQVRGTRHVIHGLLPAACIVRIIVSGQLKWSTPTLEGDL